MPLGSHLSWLLLHPFIHSSVTLGSSSSQCIMGYSYWVIHAYKKFTCSCTCANINTLFPVGVLWKYTILNIDREVGRQIKVTSHDVILDWLSYAWIIINLGVITVVIHSAVIRKQLSVSFLKCSKFSRLECDWFSVEIQTHRWFTVDIIDDLICVRCAFSLWRNLIRTSATYPGDFHLR